MTRALRSTLAALVFLPGLALAQTPAPDPAPTPDATPAPEVAPAPEAAPGIAATVMLTTGSVTVDGRPVAANDSVYERQTVVVGPNSYANLRFTDGGRVLLRPNSEFTVEAYRFAGLAPAPVPASDPATDVLAPTPPTVAGGTAFFRLVRGGFRAISGLIGKADRQQYRVTTPAATIGIRGTDYEVQICSTDCPSVPATAGADGTLVASTGLAGLQLAQAGEAPAGGGVIVATNEGSIGLRTSRGEFVVDVGQVALALANGRTFMLPAVPDALLLNPTSPEDCE